VWACIVEKGELLEFSTWNQVYDLLLHQAERIRKSGFRPAVIVGVSRGGLIPARVLSDLLDNPNLVTVTAEFYPGFAGNKNNPVLTKCVSKAVVDKKVLVVDEIVDTGSSLSLVKEHILKQGAAEVRIATLYYKARSVLKPEYYEKETDSWIIFPWDLKETIKRVFDRNARIDAVVEKETAKFIEVGTPPYLVKKFLSEIQEGRK